MEHIIQVGIGVLIVRENRVLLGHRVRKGKDTGGIYEPGTWCLPGGKQEYHETILEGAKREVREETGLEVWDLQIFSAVDDIQPDKHFVTVQVIANGHGGEARVMEPDKQDEWRWFSFHDLPEKFYSPSEKFIRAYMRAHL